MPSITDRMNLAVAADTRETASPVLMPSFSAAGDAVRACNQRRIDRKAVLSLHPRGAALAPDGASVDAGAILILADQCMGMLLRSVHGSELPIVTIDLRVDWIGCPAPAESLDCLSHVVAQDGDMLLLQSDVRGEGGRGVAFVNGRFLVSGDAGHVTRAALQETTYAHKLDPFQSFDDLLDLRKGPGGGFRIEPSGRFVGAPYVPSWHGGVIAGALQTATRLRLSVDRPYESMRAVSISAEFHRPANATRPLTIDVSPVRSGRMLAIYDANAYDDAEKVVARATLSFTSNSHETGAASQLEALFASPGAQ